ncbi:hypothetical protein [Azospirillum picis]|uniref:Uncharacterized protein n=1 Tax=Azospirillum picis TaxID=488438 RepID=A0ABU0MQC4_9PROT|nr:hypothetical protein [Azospirillum picis]MBP2301592.1 hypothetical protein [Azospirillum picis]MDQ0535424.1 hypothetical protein [Azospirillum picis]
MHETLQGGLDLAWWITAVELPAMTALFWLIVRARKDAESAFAALRENLAAYKLEVAKTYVSVATLRDVEQRLTDHLLRIETKLDSGFIPFGDPGRR